MLQTTQLDDIQRQIDTAQRSIQRRLYLLAAAQLEAAAVILRLVHTRHKSEAAE